MNPLKCAFDVISGKFLGFVVQHQGIEIDQAKVKAIRDMPKTKNLKELRGLQGPPAYIRRFISNLADRCHPFSHLMKKGHRLNGMNHARMLSKASRNICQVHRYSVLQFLVSLWYYTLLPKKDHWGHYVPKKIRKAKRELFTTWVEHWLGLNCITLQ